MMNCKYCNKVIEGQRRTKQFCSTSCRVLMHKQRKNRQFKELLLQDKIRTNAANVMPNVKANVTTNVTDNVTKTAETPINMGKGGTLPNVNSNVSVNVTANVKDNVKRKSNVIEGQTYPSAISGKTAQCSLCKLYFPAAIMKDGIYDSRCRYCPDCNKKLGRYRHDMKGY